MGLLVDFGSCAGCAQEFREFAGSFQTRIFFYDDSAVFNVLQPIGCLGIDLGQALYDVPAQLQILGVEFEHYGVSSATHYVVSTVAPLSTGGWCIQFRFSSVSKGGEFMPRQ